MARSWCRAKPRLPRSRAMARKRNSVESSPRRRIRWYCLPRRDEDVLDLVLQARLVQQASLRAHHVHASRRAARSRSSISSPPGTAQGETSVQVDQGNANRTFDAFDDPRQSSLEIRHVHSSHVRHSLRICRVRRVRGIRLIVRLVLGFGI